VENAKVVLFISKLGMQILIGLEKEYRKRRDERFILYDVDSDLS
jgi:hypothetical protein